MKGRARVLDIGFLEFVEYLQKIGELQNTVRIIDSISLMSSEEVEAQDNEFYQANKSGIDLLFPFWRKGWIEIRETERKGKDRQIKEYALLLHLEEIADYFSQEKDHRTRSSGYPLSKQNSGIFA